MGEVIIANVLCINSYRDDTTISLNFM